MCVSAWSLAPARSLCVSAAGEGSLQPADARPRLSRAQSSAGSSPCRMLGPRRAAASRTPAGPRALNARAIPLDRSRCASGPGANAFPRNGTREGYASDERSRKTRRKNRLDRSAARHWGLEMRDERASWSRFSGSVGVGRGRGGRRLATAEIRAQGGGQTRLPFRLGPFGGRGRLWRRCVGRAFHRAIKAGCRNAIKRRFGLCIGRTYWLYGRFLRFRRRSSVVERILGKAEVVGSIPPGGTI
jgi:hypothetical protein